MWVLKRPKAEIRVQICQICIPNLSWKVADPSEHTIRIAAQWSPIAMTISPRPYLHAWTAKVLTALVPVRLSPLPPHISGTIHNVAYYFSSPCSNYGELNHISWYAVNYLRFQHSWWNFIAHPLCLIQNCLMRPQDTSRIGNTI